MPSTSGLVVGIPRSGSGKMLVTLDLGSVGRYGDGSNCYTPELADALG